MQELQIFNNPEFGEIRTIQKSGQIMFCLVDVCKALDINNARQVRTRLNEDGVTTNDTIDNMGRIQNATFINESNLYKIIFQSRKESAERFTDWVTSEVLPSIRKTGGYNLPQTYTEALEHLLIKAKENDELKSKNKLLLVDNERMRPKEIFADAVACSDTDILVGELAKMIAQNGCDIGQKRLFAWLRDNKYLMRDNIPMQRYVERGLFKIKERTINNPDGSVRITKTTLVTGKGQIYFINKFLSMTA